MGQMKLKKREKKFMRRWIISAIIILAAGCAVAPRQAPQAILPAVRGEPGKSWKSDKWGFELSLPADWQMEIYNQIEGDLKIAAIRSPGVLLEGKLTLAKLDEQFRCDDWIRLLYDVFTGADKPSGVFKEPSGDAEATGIYPVTFRKQACQMYMRSVKRSAEIFTLTFIVKKEDYAGCADTLEKYGRTLKVR
jgi:hypothetical protein